MSGKLFRSSSLFASGLPAFRLLESAFALLDLIILAVLLLFHSWFSSYLGNPSNALVVVLGAGFFLRSLELIWVQSLSELPSRRTQTTLAWASISFDLALAVVLGLLSDTDDSPYYVLMIVPTLRAAFRFSGLRVIGVIAVCDFFTFVPVWSYFRHHPPVEVLEYLEAAMSSLVFSISGGVVWMLVQHVREREAHVEDNLVTLYEDRSRWEEEEKSSALARLSSSIAAEIRDPLRHISAALAGARQVTGTKHDEALHAASRELAHLSSVVTDFLGYANLQRPSFMPISLTVLAREVVAGCSSLAAEKAVHLQLQTEEDLLLDGDAGQLRQALSNIVKNAVEACPAKGTVCIKIYAADETVHIDIENPGRPVPESERSHLFEPFFTTKAGASGMGLPTARKIARAHGGDLALIANDPQRICFSLSLPSVNVDSESQMHDGLGYPSVHS